MPNAPDHLDPKETTEARLCAYLEGELPPLERIEIEKHLKVNPQHRQLLNDLAQTRDWMRSIPRESAPPEMAEAFAAHMERSLLLDYKQDTGPSTISRLSQYGLLAAIVVIALGLGVAVAMILRGGRNPYTMGPTTSAPMNAASKSITPSTAPLTDDLASAGSKMASRSIEKPAIVPDSSSPPPSAVAAAATPSPADLTAAQPIIRRAMPPAPISYPETLAEDHADLAKVETALRDRKLTSDRRTICLLVSTSTPAATAEQVHRFFASHQIVFDDQKRAEIFPDVATASAANNTNKIAQDTAGGFGGGVQNSKVQPRTQADQLQTKEAKNNENFAANNGFFQKQNTATTALPTTLPAPLSNKIDDAAEIIYVGRGLTPLQLELLHGTLATGGIDQTVKRLDLSQPIIPQKPIPITQANGGSLITKGQTLTVTVPQLVAPGIEKTNIVKVAEDGTINLPMLDPIRADGASVPELQDRIAAKYREANLIPAATVTVSLNSLTTQPTTQPAAIASANPTTAPATPFPIPIAKATTQSIEEDKIDVVVYLRKTK